MTIGVALVGSGIFVQEQHLPAVQSSSSLTLKAIYSRSLKSAQSLSSSLPDTSGITLYSSDSEHSYDALLSNKEIDAVIIALPIPAQPEYIKAASKAGKHVLSEKPIAKDISTAQSLLSWYRSSISPSSSAPTWSVAENFRYMSRFQHAGEQVAKLGRVLGFRHRMHAYVAPGSKYYETAWRKTPEYQGGFSLDGGVHFIAGSRSMLGDDAKMDTVSAFSAQSQKHLPPVDTVNASVKSRNGASGTFSVSFGTTFTGAEWIVACEQGTVECDRDRVIVKKGEEESVEEFPDDGNGVVQEVRAWAESIEQGKQDASQSPEEASRDLEILEAMLNSGEANGAPVQLKSQ